jgi:manganese/zinc/iron transport system substrate-binding protein
MPPALIRRRSLILGLAVAPLLPGLARAQVPLQVVATTGMIADTARVLGGDVWRSGP